MFGAALTISVITLHIIVGTTFANLTAGVPRAIARASKTSVVAGAIIPAASTSTAVSVVVIIAVSIVASDALNPEAGDFLAVRARVSAGHHQ